MTTNFSGTQKLKNSKLNTIAWLGWLMLIAGIILSASAGRDFEQGIIGLTLIGGSISLWVTWLAIGAIVDAIHARKF